MEIAGQKFSLTGYQEEGQNFMLTPKEGIFRGFMFEPVEKENKVSLKLEKTQEVYILN